MKTGNQSSDLDASAAIPIDPFAVDFFGSVGPVLDDEELPDSHQATAGPRKRKSKSDWYRVLPKVSNRDAALSNSIAALPTRMSAELLEILSEAIARFTFSESVGCEIISITEVDLNFAVAGLSSRPRVYLNVGCRTENCAGSIVLDVEFASLLVDSVLDGPGEDFAGRRVLSPIEATIVEFMTVNVVSAVNDLAGDAIFILEGVETRTGPRFSDNERGAEIVFSLRFGERNGIVTLVLSAAILRNLSRSGRHLVTDSRSSRKFGDAESILPQVGVRLVAGFTTLDSASLIFLEPDDIVMIDRPLIDHLGQPVGAGPFALIGSGGAFKLRGAAEDNGFNGNLLFRIDEILSEEARRVFTPAKFKMDEKEKDAPTEEVISEETEAETTTPSDEQLSSALDNIQVALRVEIAGNKISLRELQDLRAGQIIALGCSPNDPVRLVTDNNEDPIATGELIEIEGQLGVRLTKVFI